MKICASLSYDSYDALRAVSRARKENLVLVETELFLVQSYSYASGNLMFRYMFNDYENASVHVATDRTDTHPVMK